MSGCFVDTTILVDVVEEKSPGKQQAEVHLAKNPPGQLPQYALREYLAGRIGILADVHNRVLASQNAGEALVALFKMPPVQGRTLESKKIELAETLEKVFAKNQSQTPEENKNSILADLSLRAARYWRRARKSKVFQYVQPLSCFDNGDISIDQQTGALIGSNGSFNCHSDRRCAGAAYLYEHRSEIKKLIDALEDENLSQELKAKRETASRRKALRELLNKGPIAFDKGRCRALGDAYFALMSPAGYAVLTTNISDHLPLCEAINKIAIKPLGVVKPKMTRIK